MICFCRRTRPGMRKLTYGAPLWRCLRKMFEHTGVWTKWPPFRRRHLKCVLFNEKVLISIKISRRFVPKGPIDNTLALVKGMFFGIEQATSHSLNQCWPRRLAPYGVTRPQCVYWQNIWWINHRKRPCAGHHAVVNHNIAELSGEWKPELLCNINLLYLFITLK